MYLSTALFISSLVLSVDASIYLSAFLIPAVFDISDTVTGLSPDITFISTPLFSKNSNVFSTLSRILSSIIISAIFSISLSNLSLVKSLLYLDNKSTLYPFDEYFSTLSFILIYSSFSTNSGAPITKLPSSLKETPLHFLSDNP